MKEMEKILKEKDVQIQKQRSDLTSLRQKNFKFRSRITELEDKAKVDEDANGARQNSRNPRGAQQRRPEESGQNNESSNEMALAI